MWANMKDTGLPKDMKEALELVRASETQSSGFALIADATDVRWVVSNHDMIVKMFIMISSDIYP